MSNNRIETLTAIVQERRTIKPDRMNGGKIPDEQVMSLLELADWAPTHGMTEPWRFVVYAGLSVTEFCRQHAELYLVNTQPTSFLQANYDKLLHMGDKASHIIIAVMKRGTLPKVPPLEEIAATSCAIQNMLLGATALGLAAYWGSGGMAHHHAMKEFLNLELEDTVLGILYFGYADLSGKGRRTVPLQDKITWNS